MEANYPKKINILRIGNIKKISKEVYDTTLDKIKKITNKKDLNETIKDSFKNSDIIATTIDSTYTNWSYQGFIRESKNFDYTIIDKLENQ